jgi:hypothetical protein
MVGFGDQVPTGQRLKIASDSSEYNDWDGTAACLLSQLPRCCIRWAAIAIGVADNQVGPFAIGNGPCRPEFVRFKSFRTLSIEERAQNISRFPGSIHDQHSRFGRQ